MRNLYTGLFCGIYTHGSFYCVQHIQGSFAEYIPAPSTSHAVILAFFIFFSWNRHSNCAWKCWHLHDSFSRVTYLCDHEFTLCVYSMCLLYVCTLAGNCWHLHVRRICMPISFHPQSPAVAEFFEETRRAYTRLFRGIYSKKPCICPFLLSKPISSLDLCYFLRAS